MIFLSIQSHSQLLLSNAFTHSLSLWNEKISGQIHHLLVSMLVTSWMLQNQSVSEGLLIFYCEAVSPSAHLQLQDDQRRSCNIYIYIYIQNACGFCSVLPQSKQTLIALHHEAPYHLISMEEHYCISISPLEFCFQFESSFV